MSSHADYLAALERRAEAVPVEDALLWPRTPIAGIQERIRNEVLPGFLSEYGLRLAPRRQLRLQRSLRRYDPSVPAPRVSSGTPGGSSRGRGG